MEPTLHQAYTIDEAVAAFGRTSRAEFECDRQFVVLSTAVLCMATVSDPATQPHLVSPSCVVWKPARIDYSPFDLYPWLPSSVHKVWGPDRSKIKQHHVFLRRPPDERFVYAGKAHLGSFGGPRTDATPARCEATFSLDEKLPRPEWLRLGGYPGWLIDINHCSERVDNGDLEAFRRLVVALPSQEFSHLSMTRYEEDMMTLYTNAQRGWLQYQQDPADFVGLQTGDPARAGDPQTRELFRCVCGIELDFPTAQTLPRDLAMLVAEEFFSTGTLPQGVRWHSS